MIFMCEGLFMSGIQVNTQSMVLSTKFSILGTILHEAEQYSIKNSECPRSVAFPMSTLGSHFRRGYHIRDARRVFALLEPTVRAPPPGKSLVHCRWDAGHLIFTPQCKQNDVVVK
jgi:hypothetical protein